jgi:hypothetical protein
LFQLNDVMLANARKYQETVIASDLTGRQAAPVADAAALALPTVIKFSEFTASTDKSKDKSKKSSKRGEKRSASSSSKKHKSKKQRTESSGPVGLKDMVHSIKKMVNKRPTSQSLRSVITLLVKNMPNVLFFSSHL